MVIVSKFDPSLGKIAVESNVKYESLRCWTDSDAPMSNKLDSSSKRDRLSFDSRGNRDKFKTKEQDQQSPSKELKASSSCSSP
jgi:hypothetical protein